MIPFPVLIEVTDGYCDDQEQRPGIQTECEREPRRRSPAGAAPDIALLLHAPLAGGS